LVRVTVVTLRKSFLQLGLYKTQIFAILIKSGVEAERAVSEIPTPLGVASDPKD